MSSEDQNKKLISKEIVKIYIEMEPFFSLLFTAYHQTNYGKRRIVELFHAVSHLEGTVSTGEKDICYELHSDAR